MRWIQKPWGQNRIVKRFLFLPCEINNEVRWLEVATIEKQYVGHWGGGDWQNVRFIDKNKE